MKTGCMIIDFNKETVSVLGEQVDMIPTSTGHFCIPLSRFAVGKDDSVFSNVVLITEALKDLTRYSEERN